MPLVKRSISSTEWTLISSNTSVVSFQNVGSRPICIAYSSSNIPPEETLGWVYPPYQGEIQKEIGTLSGLSGNGYIFARAISQSSSIIVNEEEE